MSRRLLPLLFGLLVLAVSGCSNDGLGDLREFVANAHKDRKPSVEPIPEIKPHETFIYAASNLPDPFTPYNKRAMVGKGNGLRPDMNRRKEPLEEFPLDALKMVGTLSRGKESWGVVQAPDGTVYRVQKGNHLGQNYGTIIKVTEEKINLIEIIPGSLGGWVEREASLAIAE
jgi:type IV pilus assembly protein PilP